MEERPAVAHLAVSEIAWASGVGDYELWASSWRYLSAPDLCHVHVRAHALDQTAAQGTVKRR